MNKLTTDLYRRHERVFEHNRFVYPVVSRRSGGVSLGVNLNPDKVCNFDCTYCQVDRVEKSEIRFVEMDRFAEELDAAICLIASGALYKTEKFCDVPAALRVFRDIALSGDGEPTTYKNFDTIIERCIEIKDRYKLDDVQIRLITNASMFQRPHVERGLRLLGASGGEIWAKLDAGTSDYFQQIARTSISFEQILTNITAAAQRQPLVIQSMFCRTSGEGPADAEIEAFCQRLTDILLAGGQLKLVQIYTVARRPAESSVAPLRDDEVDQIVARVRQQTGIAAIGYYGLSQE